jgi:2'-5' RNA ligase
LSDNPTAEPPAYHLWLKPGGAASDLLSKTIVRLSRELRTPVFEPHVTLAGPLEGSEQKLIERADRLGALLAPFEIVLDEPRHGPDYFRCMFMRAEPGIALMHANATAARVFSLPDRPYMPHVSLVYGSLNQEERQRVVSTLPGDLRLSFTATGFDLIRSDSPEPKDWHSVCSRSFGRQGAVTLSRED